MEYQESYEQESSDDEDFGYEKDDSYFREKGYSEEDIRQKKLITLIKKNNETLLMAAENGASRIIEQLLRE